MWPFSDHQYARQGETLSMSLDIESAEEERRMVAGSQFGWLETGTPRGRRGRERCRTGRGPVTPAMFPSLILATICDWRAARLSRFCERRRERRGDRHAGCRTGSHQTRERMHPRGPLARLLEQWHWRCPPVAFLGERANGPPRYAIVGSGGTTRRGWQPGSPVVTGCQASALRSTYTSAPRFRHVDEA